MAEDADPETALINKTATIVSAYVTKSHVPVHELPNLIRSVHGMLDKLDKGAAPEPEQAARPAVPINKSITDDHVISLEDGKKFKSLKRHLMTTYGMTPDDYRRKWGLAQDYPMVAPAYAKSRSALARAMGLGRKTSPATAVPGTDQDAAEGTPAKDGRGRAKAAKPAP